MAQSVNKAILVGRLGKDPESRSFANGGKVVNFSLATSETWKGKDGQKQERTQWHNVVIFNEALAGIAERFLKKGSLVMLEGSIENRKYEKDGQDRYVTEIVIRPYRGEITMLDTKRDDQGQGGHDSGRDYQAPNTGSARSSQSSKIDELEDEIPF